MRKTFCTTLIAVTLGLTGTAFAGHDDGLPGNQGCFHAVGPDGNVVPRFKNPGKMFQAVKDGTGLNPKQWVDTINDALGTEYTVGEWIDLNCDDPAI